MNTVRKELLQFIVCEIVLVLVVSHINVMNCKVYFHSIGAVPQSQQVCRSVHLGS